VSEEGDNLALTPEERAALIALLKRRSTKRAFRIRLGGPR
jgi:hypothetical protein